MIPLLCIYVNTFSSSVAREMNCYKNSGRFPGIPPLREKSGKPSEKTKSRKFSHIPIRVIILVLHSRKLSLQAPKNPKFRVHFGFCFPGRFNSDSVKDPLTSMITIIKKTQILFFPDCHPQ